MIKIALVEYGNLHLHALEGKNPKDIDIDIYWYPGDMTEEEISGELDDLQEFYDLVVTCGYLEGEIENGNGK